MQERKQFTLLGLENTKKLESIVQIYEIFMRDLLLDKCGGFKYIHL